MAMSQIPQTKINAVFLMLLLLDDIAFYFNVQLCLCFQGDSVQLDSLFFAVKTYHKFHNTRVQVVKKTWGKFPIHLLFFSDKNGKKHNYLQNIIGRYYSFTKYTFVFLHVSIQFHKQKSYPKISIWVSTLRLQAPKAVEILCYHLLTYFLHVHAS